MTTPRRSRTIAFSLPPEMQQREWRRRERLERLRSRKTTTEQDDIRRND